MQTHNAHIYNHIIIINAINKAVKATTSILKSARIDSLREDGPARGQLLISPQQSRQLSHYAKNRRENETTEPPPCVIYPKGGKGNARSKPGKEWSYYRRLHKGKVLARGRY